MGRLVFNEGDGLRFFKFILEATIREGKILSVMSYQGQLLIFGKRKILLRFGEIERAF
ncbi:conserved hypothetical protein [Ricinus communis]|uniref:Uncharacterized protein n=1 Tax=Ricinus communis TaxID=3988 RepID=B9SR34_RICCO|nr:conserved hypothetical protein [Ricinus communis]